jgi:hypothetical protein
VGHNSRRSCRARGPVLQLLKRERYAIIAGIEYDYAGAQDPLKEVKKCFAYCHDTLE